MGPLASASSQLGQVGVTAPAIPLGDVGTRPAAAVRAVLQGDYPGREAGLSEPSFLHSTVNYFNY